MNSKSSSNHVKNVKKFVWDNFSLLEMAEEVLRQRAVEVYLKYFEEKSIPLDDVPEDEIIRMGESELNAELIEKLVMVPDEIYKHPLLEKYLEKHEVSVEELKNGLNYYSNNKHIIFPHYYLEGNVYDKLNFHSNTIMLLQGYGQLKGFLYSKKCSKSRTNKKIPCFIEWCSNKKYVFNCPLKNMFKR